MTTETSDIRWWFNWYIGRATGCTRMDVMDQMTLVHVAGHWWKTEVLFYWTCTSPKAHTCNKGSAVNSPTRALPYLTCLDKIRSGIPRFKGLFRLEFESVKQPSTCDGLRKPTNCCDTFHVDGCFTLPNINQKKLLNRGIPVLILSKHVNCGNARIGLFTTERLFYTCAFGDVDVQGVRAHTNGVTFVVDNRKC